MKAQKSENPSALEEIPDLSKGLIDLYDERLKKEAQEERYVLGCPRCGHQWEPNPNKWTNIPYVWWKGRLARVMYCPRCGLRSHFYKSDIEIYKEWYDAKKRKKPKKIQRD